MTDARGIIAHQIPGTSAEVCFGLAEAIMNKLDAAGYVILSPDDVRALEKIAYGNINGVWQEKFEAAQDISRDILRNLKGEAA